MAIEKQTIKLAGDIRIVLDQTVDAATRDIVAAWARTWSNLVVDWTQAVSPRRLAHVLGTKPTRAQIRNEVRVQAALVATRIALNDLAKYAGVRILQEVDYIAQLAAEAQRGMVESQLPANSAATVKLLASLERVDPRQLEAIVVRTTQQVTSLATALQPLGMEAINNELVRGIALGLNPRTVARDMVKANRIVNDIQHGFNLPLSRAMIIARTEMLDAHRAAAAVGQQAHADILAGWMWLSKLDTRTCPSCWAQHGKTHPLDELGPLDHQQGRCARLPVTKPWAELGFDIIEPPSLIENAREKFDGLSRAEKVQILGELRMRRFEAGEIGWDDLSVRRATAGWRDSYVTAPAQPRRRQSKAA